MAEKTYKAAADGFIIGTYYKKGAVVPLTELQAKYLTAPYGNSVYVDGPKVQAAVAPATTVSKTEAKPSTAKD